MSDAFKKINEDARVPVSVKKDVMWHVENVYLAGAIAKHFTVDMGNAFFKLFTDVNSINKENNNDSEAQSDDKK